MGLVNKTSSILAECARIENLNLVKPDTSGIEESLVRQLNDIETVDDSLLSYTEEMVNVHHDEKRDRYLIEFDNVSKFIRSNECTVKQAVNKICEHYDISVADTYIVIESVDLIMNQFKQSQVCAESANSVVKAYGKEEVNGIYEEFNSLLESGIKLLARPSYGITRIY